MGAQVRHAARVDRSARLQRVVEVLKTADHPLSAEEIAVRGYDFNTSKKIMLNVSTAVGEIRAPVNSALGYVVSEAHTWKSPRYPWHDGRPRYWLIAAPGWSPSWTITAEGNLELYRRGGEVERHSEPESDRHGPPVAGLCVEGLGETKDEGIASDVTERVCKNPNCKKPLPPEDPLSWCCNDDCRRQWRESLYPQQKQDGPQGRLL